MSKVMISMPEGLLEEFDRAAQERHKRRSELIKDLILEFLRKDKLQSRQPTLEELREFTFELELGETTEGLIRTERDSH